MKNRGEYRNCHGSVLSNVKLPCVVVLIVLTINVHIFFWTFATCACIPEVMRYSDLADILILEHTHQGCRSNPATTALFFI